MTPGPRYCTHAKEFHALERRAERAEGETERLHGIISDLRDNEAYLKRRLEVMQDRERKLLAAPGCNCQFCNPDLPCPPSANR